MMDGVVISADVLTIILYTHIVLMWINNFMGNFKSSNPDPRTTPFGKKTEWMKTASPCPEQGTTSESLLTGTSLGWARQGSKVIRASQPSVQEIGHREPDTS